MQVVDGGYARVGRHSGLAGALTTRGVGRSSAGRGRPVASGAQAPAAMHIGAGARMWPHGPEQANHGQRLPAAPIIRRGRHA